ncbi:MAG TPA: hypothetical protein QF924_19105 [Pseudomonadales bacterium]|jgi:hypothetical protein|nr:hypothetical protein [Pseudomonadales bacterium]|tara:strand:- start:176 stop:574 length:399 start_codon:yes stop_codon:yes gene_type:complete
MKILAWSVGIVLGVFALFGLTQWAASERVEVVQLNTTNDEGATVTTRLWVVDHEGLSYLRAGEGSGWYARLISNPSITLERNGNIANFRATANRDKVEIINRLMNDKYTWGDDFFALFVDREDSIPIELQSR